MKGKMPIQYVCPDCGYEGEDPICPHCNLPAESIGEESSPNKGEDSVKYPAELLKQEVPFSELSDEEAKKLQIDEDL